jgi:hypothetical protein
MRRYFEPQRQIYIWTRGPKANPMKINASTNNVSVQLQTDNLNL